MDRDEKVEDGWEVMTIEKLTEIELNYIYIIYQVQKEEVGIPRKDMDADLPFGLEVRLRVVGGWRPIGMYFHLQLGSGQSGSLLYCKSWDEKEKDRRVR